MKKRTFISIIIALFLLQACSRHYTKSQPTFSAVTRPNQPSAAHVWVEGNWRWNRQKKEYRQKNGYWKIPKQQRSYQNGRWENDGFGYYWIPGRWN